MLHKALNSEVWQRWKSVWQETGGESKVTAFEIVAKRRLKVIPTSATLEQPWAGAGLTYVIQQDAVVMRSYWSVRTVDWAGVCLTPDWFTIPAYPSGPPSICLPPPHPSASRPSPVHLDHLPLSRHVPRVMSTRRRVRSFYRALIIPISGAVWRPADGCQDGYQSMPEGGQTGHLQEGGATWYDAVDQ